MTSIRSSAVVVGMFAMLVAGWATPVAAVDLTRGLLAYWPLDGDAQDASGYGNHGTVYGATPTAGITGAPGTAYSLDGVDDYIDIGPGVKPPLPLSISLWFQDRDPGSMRSLFRNDYVQDDGNRYGIEILQSGGIWIQLYEGFSSSTNRRTYYTGNVPGMQDGDWHHLSVVMPSLNEALVYIDDSPRNAPFVDGTGSGMTYSSGSGALGYRIGDTPPFTAASFDEVLVYNRALSPAEVHALSLGIPPGNPGDYNRDGVIDPSDYAYWSNAYQTILEGGFVDLNADGNYDGVVDPSDYAVWSGRYLLELSGGGSAGVPEPGTLALLALAGLAIARRQ